MASGDQVRALRIANRTKGWNGAEMMEAFDVAPEPWNGKYGIGAMPAGKDDNPTLSERVTWNAPDRASGTDRVNRTANLQGGNNAPGEGGAAGGSSAPGIPGGG